MYARVILSVLALSLSFSSYAEARGARRSDLTGLKYPNSPEEGEQPVPSYAEALRGPYGGFNELLPYVIASPDQEDAGSCLYMSLTGVAEWWLARLNPHSSRRLEGPLDLSERYLMNLAGISEAGNGMENWKTDSIYLYNKTKKGVRNSAYRFTKNWHVTDEKGDLKPAQEGDEGAEYTTSYNWINELKTIRKGFVPLPKFEREVIFADPASDQWNVGVMPANIVDQVKAKLQERKAPVHVIYNHMGYWHAVNILGYDDALDSNECQFVTKFRKYMDDEPRNLRLEARKTDDPVARAKLIKRAEKMEKTALKFERAYRKGGGCNEKGMFYVRDSIYADEAFPYDFDPSKPGTEGHYSKPIILREYAWLKFMSNHATQIYIK